VLSIGEALHALVPCFAPRPTVRLALREALGCVLAEDVRSGRDLPGFDNSAMDGYALRHAELAASRTLAVAGESRAGGEPPGALAAASALRIFTGAPLPAGADTVVIQEHAQLDAAGRVGFRERPERGANVRRSGSDLRAGEVALAAGTELGAAEVAFLAALGVQLAPVHARPSVAIVSVGDELRAPGDDLPPHAIVNSNAILLEHAVRALGCEPQVLRIARDDVEDIARVLGDALRHDAVLSTGGVSVGDYDCVARAAERAGVAERFAKVAIKPGKPLWFGLRGEVPLLGLPGNPVSTLVGFEVFARPALRRMLGHAAPYPALVAVRLEHAHRHGTGRPELARARLRADARGLLHATLHDQQGSGSLPSMVRADALVLLDADRAELPAGSSHKAQLLRGGPFQTEPAYT
jgi:molybdopterin molybdotransferase